MEVKDIIPRYNDATFGAVIGNRCGNGVLRRRKVIVAEEDGRGVQQGCGMGTLIAYSVGAVLSSEKLRAELGSLGGYTITAFHRGKLMTDSSITLFMGSL